MGWKVESPEDLDYYAARLEDAGIAVKRLQGADVGVGGGTVVRFETPSGHQMELIHGMEQVGNLLPLTNPPPKPLGLVGIAPPRLDHIFLTVEDVNGMTAFLQEVLDFHLTEQVMGDDGFQIATWLEVSHSSHDIALVTGPDGGLHHFAYWVDDWNDIRNASDVLAYHGVRIETNPTRHGATRATAMRSSPAATGRTPMIPPSPGPRVRWGARCSTTTASSISGSSRCTAKERT
jgi:catechol 2,3-dioxygenase